MLLACPPSRPSQDGQSPACSHVTAKATTTATLRLAKPEGKDLGPSASRTAVREEQGGPSQRRQDWRARPEHRAHSAPAALQRVWTRGRAQGGGSLGGIRFPTLQ